MFDSDLYGGADPRNLPLYSQREAAHFIGVTPSTLRGWVASKRRGERVSEPVVQIPDENDGRLSFNNLIEVFVLGAMRMKHGVSMPAIRRAVDYAEQELEISRLLMRRELCWEEAGDVFWDKLSSLVSLSRSGQFAMRDLVHQSLHRIDWDEASGLPVRLFPTVAGRHDRRSIVIDPRVSFGQPTVQGSGVGTSIIARRIDAGEDVASVAEDYEVTPEQITDALVYESVD